MNHVSKQTLQRLPIYLSWLKAQCHISCCTVSAKNISDALGLTEIQVRKDLAAVSDKGKPRVGYITTQIIEDIEIFLGYKNVDNAVLAGAGKLGRALLSYKGFEEYGLNIIAGFDISKDVVGTFEENKQIFSMDKMKNLCERMNVYIGIITAPAESAQEIADLMVESGILAIWNFSPTHITVPSNVLVKNENMASSLAILSQHLSEQLI